ncbi:MAG: RnfABCDGE type electron transport complex subunit D [Clostridia bacterium]|nr:RnfABCDGE type electron transport complex subunit D [Clostridia bacterium]
MILDKKLSVSASPHDHSKDTVTRIMLDVVIALVPSLIAAFFLFGPRTLIVSAVSVGTCVLAEYLSRIVMKRHQTIADLSAVVTGLLIAFNVPTSMPLWMVVLGDIFAIVVVKQMFGGIGMNFVNPALATRIMLIASFPTEMAKWNAPFSWKTEATTTASPLGEIKNIFRSGTINDDSFAELPSLMDMFLGKRAGSLGEVCAIALIIGLIYLLARRVIKITIPLSYVGSFAVIMFIAGGFNLTFLAYQVLSGGLLLGAIFMATDYTTSPINFKGQVIFGICCGILTALIRLFGNLPEGVSFAIILMNILVPHIEHLTTPKPFGTVKEKKKKGAEG